ncbi:MAG: hypothetical protein JNG85_07195 [Spirochaetaceae bacterium]|nr:hypothetical protein [Spirochaetaceae bacterium]
MPTMYRRTALPLLALLLLLPVLSSAQPAGGGAGSGASSAASAAAPTGSPLAATGATGASAAMPREFRGIRLGMSREEVSSALKSDLLYAYRGEDDVSLLPSPNQSLIETAGLSFVRRAFFQFYEGKLWVMILSLNPDKIDHYSVYTSLTAKYGAPNLLDPRESRWEDAATRVALERPLTLRYMDLETYRKLREGSAAKESVEELERRDFLGGL